MAPRILVAAPTYDGCGYAVEKWASAYKDFTYPDKGALFVDNSDMAHYAHVCRSYGIPTIIQSRRFSFIWDTLEVAWRTILEYAHDEGYDYVASIEADIICPPETLTVMLHEMQQAGGNAVVSHRYHPRGIDNPAPPPEGMAIDEQKLRKYADECWFDTLGCTLFPTDLMWRCRHEWTTIFEVELYKQQAEQGLPRVRLKDRLAIVHLEDHEKPVVHLYGEECVDPEGNAGRPGRAHPADLSVKHPDDPPDTVWGGRRTGNEGFGLAPKVIQKPVPDPEAAQKARDDLKWATLTSAPPAEWSCAQCGKCCREFAMFTDNGEAEAIWKSRGFSPIRAEDGRSMVVLKARCEYLVENDDGTQTCGIYEDRFQWCKNYQCGRQP